MLYTLGEFGANLQRRFKYFKGLKDCNIQSDEALELLNELLPRNMMAKKLFLEEKETESVFDVKRR